MKLFSLTILVAASIASAACGASKSEPKGEDISNMEGGPPASAAIEDTNVAKGSDALADVRPVVEEVDPNAAKAVTAIDFADKAPNGAPVHGTFKTAIGWADKNGLNAIVFGVSQKEKGDVVSSLLVADFVLWEGDSWTSQRTFKESVNECDFDTILAPIVGKWSVTDLDNDGVGEASFAWRVGCRSDLTPVGHKVFVVGLGPDTKVAKYVLRGATRIVTGGEVRGNADFEADDAFKTAPPEFLEQATKVWDATSTEE